MIGDTIKRIRIAKGMSKSHLARLVSVSPTAVHNWEENGISPRPALLPVIAAALDTSVGALSNAGGLGAVVIDARARRERLSTIEEIKRQIALLYGTSVDKVSVSINI